MPVLFNWHLLKVSSFLYEPKQKFNFTINLGYFQDKALNYGHISFAYQRKFCFITINLHHIYKKNNYVGSFIENQNAIISPVLRLG